MKRLLFLLFLVFVVAPAPAPRADEKLHHRPRYTLRAGDVLELQYRYTPEFNQTVTVLPDGYVNLNVVGDVRVADLTVDQAHDLIVQKAQARLNDPELNGTFEIEEGLRAARKLLLDINALAVPTGCEYLDMITPQYIADLVSWGAIGARTTESQVHRELASGLSAPIGFKNGTDGDVQMAVDAILAARQRHHFLSVHKNGQVAIVETCGNDDCQRDGCLER